MAANHCLPQVHGCALRLAKLDTNGVPLPGASNLYVTDALSRLTVTPVYTDGDEIEEKNACGAVSINYIGDDTFKRVDVELVIVTHDPYIFEFMAEGSDLLTDGDAKGWAAPPIGIIAAGSGISVEVWAKRINDGILDGDFPYAWWAMPKVTNLRFGQRVFENGPSLPTFTGRGYENANWFDGPLNDWPVASDRCVQWVETVALPTVACGPQALAAS